ncbi:MAG: hypothetical protein KDD69_05990 [Bdellovibrionales bacterium]|nr:hypothetical protein [Bdellovibrionales bacterium]
MSQRTVPFSVRVSQEDAEFIAALEVPDASTPSDKLRAIIADARTRAESDKDFVGCWRILRELTGPAMVRLRELEYAERMHSELLRQAIECAEGLLAFVVAELDDEIKDAAKHLTQVEAGAADRVFTLIEMMLRLGTTKESKCFDPQVVSSRLGPVMELTKIISASK